MIGRVGRRTTYLAALPLLLFLAVPLLVGGHGGDVFAITSVVLRSYRGQVLPSAIALVGVGVAIVLATRFWPRRFPIEPESPRRNPQEWDAMPPPRKAPPVHGSTDRLYL